MAKSLYIAEKPSVAQEFAKALKINASRRDGYLESEDAVVTWCVGHLVTMSYPEKYDEQYKNVIACSSKQIADFVGWIQSQSFAADTAVVISGDHFTMSNTAVEWMDKNYDRRTFVSIINGSELVSNKNRVYTTLDMFPTTLAALGCTIEGNRLGLGTNLYSDTPTLAEQMGLSQLDRELALKSSYYEKNILQNK